MNLMAQIKTRVGKILHELYDVHLAEKDITINQTKPEFEGDYTLVLFSLVKQLKRSPDQLGHEIGEALVKSGPDLFADFNIIKGFLNLVITDAYWIKFLQGNFTGMRDQAETRQRIMLEYSSPNTNKPLHLGHLRNIFLGWSVAETLKKKGNTLFKGCIVNDRGIHICKSMIAWQKFAKGATPESTAKKGDHFVGDYYVLFNDECKKQVEELVQKGMNKADAEKEAPLMKETQQMLLDWEADKPEVIELWKKMNGWVYAGFDVTYKRIGADFDKMYYESQTYLPGKRFVEEGLKQDVFYKKEDGSVWIDLTTEGLDEKLVLRKDGTSVYITQDLGLAEQKFNEFKYDQSIYVIADEQNYHMKVLKLILQKFHKPYADGIDHLSYGMVELPGGRMKSREGTVVDADDILDEMVRIAKQKTEELGKVKDFTPDELDELYNVLALGALKFFLLRVDPKKRMIFNPEESIDFHGFTGPFVQYTHARIKSILRKQVASEEWPVGSTLLKLEKELIILLEQFDMIIDQSIEEHNPSVIANYVYSVARTFNSFYTEHSVLSAESEEKKNLRLQLSQLTASVISTSLHLLGITAPERM